MTPLRRRIERKGHRFILYPAFAFRVIAPKQIETELNILERAVLGLCQAGVRKAVAIAELLSIHEELAARVLRILQSKLAITSEGEIATGGKQALMNDTIATEEPVAGYVFQDPWSQRLWPWFVQRLTYAENVIRADGFQDLVRGNAGNPRRESAFTLLPKDDVAGVAPRPAEVLGVVRKHARRSRGPDEPMVEDESTSFTLVADAPRLERITHIESEPRRVYLAMMVYSPVIVIDGNRWEVADPFGGGRSKLAREAIARQVESDSELKRVVNQLLGETNNDTGSSLAGVIAELEFAATMHVTNRIGSDSRGRSLFDSAVAMERAAREAESAGDSCPPDKLDDVVVKAQIVAERALAKIHELHGNRELWRIFKGADRTDATLVNKAAEVVGFATPIPPKLASLRVESIRRAHYGSGESLRPRLVTALLSAQYKLGHPLRTAAAHRPEMLEALDNLAEIRNTRSAHAGTTEMPSLTLSSLRYHIEIVYVLAECASSGLNAQITV